MKPITETAFAYSGDCLGECVSQFVDSMAAARAEIETFPRKKDGCYDFLLDQLYEIQKAYVDLFGHLLECGINGRKIDLLQGWEIEDLKSSREVTK